MSDAERTRLRRSKLGFIYQFHHLLPEFSALENVMLPQMILGRSREDAGTRAHALLTNLGLADRVEHRPAQLSGGEQQRVAIARAVANGPKLLLADEPTGNLDPHTAERVFENLMELVRNSGLTAIIATHNLEVARRNGPRLATRRRPSCGSRAGACVKLGARIAAAKRIKQASQRRSRRATHKKQRCPGEG